MTTLVPSAVPLGGGNGGFIAVDSTSASAPVKVHTTRGTQRGWDRIEMFAANLTSTDEDLRWRVGDSGPWARVTITGSGDARLVVPNLVLRGGLTLYVYAQSNDDRLVVFGSVIENREVTQDA